MSTAVKEKRYTFVGTLARVLRIAFRAVPVVYPLAMGLAVIGGLASGYATVLMQRFFDQVTQYVGGTGVLDTLLRAVAALGGLMLATHVLGILRNFMGGQNYLRLVCAFQHVKHEKACKLRLEDFERKETLDLIEQARVGAQSSMSLMFLVVDTLAMHVPYFAFMSVYLWRLNPLLVLAMAMIFLPSVFALYLNVKIGGKIEWENAPLRRELEHAEQCVGDRAYCKEARTLNANNFFIARYRKVLGKLIKIERKQNYQHAAIEVGVQLLNLLGYAGVLWLLLNTMLQGRISVGAFAAVFASVGTMFAQMNHAVNLQGIYMSYHLAPAYNFMRFLDLPEHTGDDAQVDASAGIVLDHVSFTYPQSSTPAISNLSLRVAPRETLAIVGMNGAGKTTLARLMMGLYQPQEGTVHIGGVDTCKAAPAALYARVSATFQQFKRYRLSLSQNVRISDMGSDQPPEGATQGAGLEVDKGTFPEGWETMLSREFDGVDLSGGQWQRVAIARGLYRAHDFILLDEPTAAIDPLEETRVFRQFADMARDKTAVLVTHRLGSARIADRIVVMHEGNIAEVGTHESLIKANGVYADMYAAQAKWYAD